jgi:hypothetical protein
VSPCLLERGKKILLKILIQIIPASQVGDQGLTAAVKGLIESHDPHLKIRDPQRFGGDLNYFFKNENSHYPIQEWCIIIT